MSAVFATFLCMGLVGTPHKECFVAYEPVYENISECLSVVQEDIVDLEDNGFWENNPKLELLRYGCININDEDTVRQLENWQNEQ